MSTHESAGPAGERRSWLALLPIGLTLVFYRLPASWQEHLLVVFLPQITAYLAMTIWLAENRRALDRLGLAPSGLTVGLRYGLPTGMILGTINVLVILFVVPRLGGDILFLRETPHARMPAWFMFPWFIVTIAVLVELNFRGFLLGRVLTLWQSGSLHGYDRVGQAVALVVSAMLFAFDPFMVTTFRHLHWIAVWDGLIWGWLRIRFGTLYAAIIAHAVEVLILYAVLKLVLSP